MVKGVVGESLQKYCFPFLLRRVVVFEVKSNSKVIGTPPKKKLSIPLIIEKGGRKKKGGQVKL